MKNKIIFVFFLIFSLEGIFYSKDSKSDDYKNTIKEYRKEIELIKQQHGKRYYVGEGLSDDKDINSAVNKAKDSAMVDLLKSVRVRINSYIVDELKYSEGKVNERFEKVINTYINQLIEIVQDKRYIDYPKKNMVTVIVYVDRELYDEKVKKDLQLKVQKIKDYILEGNKKREIFKIKESIENYVKARDYLKEYFEDLPVRDEILEKGKEEDFGSFIDREITTIMNSIKIEKNEESYIYTNDGKLPKKPVVSVYYESEGERIPMSGIPIGMKFVKNSGVFQTTELASSNTGDLYLPIERIEPSEKDASLEVFVDIEKLNLKEIPNIPSVSIRFIRAKTIGWVFNFFNNGKLERPGNFLLDIRSSLSSSGYNLKEMETTDTTIDEKLIEEAKSANLDYIFYIYAKSNTSKDEYEMYRSYAEGKIFIYSIYDDYLLETVEIKGKSGYSTSKSSSSYSALGKLKGEIISILKERIKNIK
jgi:hypothetical protein